MSVDNLETHPPPYCANVERIQPSAPPYPYQQCRQMLADMVLDNNVNTPAKHQCPCMKDLNMDMNISMTFNCGACSSKTHHTYQRNNLLQRNEGIQQNRYHPQQDYLPQNRNCCNRVEIQPKNNKGNMPMDNYEYDNGPLSIYDLDTNYPCKAEPEVDYDNQKNQRRSNYANTKIGLHRIHINSLDNGYEKRREWMVWRTEMNEELVTIISEARKNRQVCLKSHDHNLPLSATSVAAVVDHAFCRPRGLPMSSLEWKHFVLFGIPRAHLQL